MICFFLLTLLVVFAKEDVVKQEREEFIRRQIGDVLGNLYDTCNMADCESELNACRQAATQRAVRVDFEDESFVFATGTPRTSFAELMDEVKAQFKTDAQGLRFVYTLDGYQFEVRNDKTLSAAWAATKELSILLKVKTLRRQTTRSPTGSPLPSSTQSHSPSPAPITPAPTDMPLPSAAPITPAPTDMPLPSPAPIAPYPTPPLPSPAPIAPDPTPSPLLSQAPTTPGPSGTPSLSPTPKTSDACNLKPKNTNRMLVLTSASESVPVAYEYVKVLKRYKVAVDVSNTWTKGVPSSSGCSDYGTISICLKKDLPPAISIDIRARLENFMKMGGRIMMCSGSEGYGRATTQALQKTTTRFVYDLLAKGWRHRNSKRHRNDQATPLLTKHGRASYWAKGDSSIPNGFVSYGDYTYPAEDIMYKSSGITPNVASVAKHTVGKGGIIWYADRLFDEDGFEIAELRKAVYLGVTGGQGKFFD